MALSVGSLFAGIGGIDLGLERAGLRIAWQCEIDPWCRGVLRRHWPDVPCYHDVRDLGWVGEPWREVWVQPEPVDVLAGGFPCQPVSLAGRKRGEDDERWLWPAFAAAIRNLRPRYVVVENVPGLLVRGMGDVLGDLARLGFDAEWCRFGAWHVGAPHRRERVWLIAWAASGGVPDAERGQLRVEWERRRQQRREQGPAEPGDDGAPRPLADAGVERRAAFDEWAAAGGGQARPGVDRRAAAGAADVADTDGERLPRLAASDSTHRRVDLAFGHDAARRGVDGGGDRARPADPARTTTGAGFEQGTGGDVADADGTRRRTRGRLGPPAAAAVERDRGWSVEPDVGRVADGVPDRVDRLRALGNAVVPACAEHVGRLLIDLDRQLHATYAERGAAGWGGGLGRPDCRTPS